MFVELLAFPVFEPLTQSSCRQTNNVCKGASTWGHITLWDSLQHMNTARVVEEIFVEDDPVKVSLNECDFFVQASRLPFMLMHKAMAEVLGNAMDSFLEMDVMLDKGVGEMISNEN
ncbi:hypothetical protein OROMI_017514 [Orobanche minor]